MTTPIVLLMVGSRRMIFPVNIELAASQLTGSTGIDESQDLDNLTKGLHKVIIGSENANMWERIYTISNATAGGSIEVLAG